RDGNQYRVLSINGKTWFLENLRFVNDIGYVEDNFQWSNAQYPAYAYYEHDEKNRDTYGILYNGFAVTTGNLCPEGWRVPTINEYMELVDIYGIDGLMA